MEYYHFKYKNQNHMAQKDGDNLFLNIYKTIHKDSIEFNIFYFILYSFYYSNILNEILFIYSKINTNNKSIIYKTPDLVLVNQMFPSFIGGYKKQLFTYVNESSIALAISDFYLTVVDVITQNNIIKTQFTNYFQKNLAPIGLNKEYNIADFLHVFRNSLFKIIKNNKSKKNYEISYNNINYSLKNITPYFSKIFRVEESEKMLLCLTVLGFSIKNLNYFNSLDLEMLIKKQLEKMKKNIFLQVNIYDTNHIKLFELKENKAVLEIFKDFIFLSNLKKGSISYKIFKLNKRLCYAKIVKIIKNKKNNKDSDLTQNKIYIFSICKFLLDKMNKSLDFFLIKENGSILHKDEILYILKKFILKIVGSVI